MRREIVLTLATACGLALSPLMAQRAAAPPQTARPALKGVWEPVSYPADIHLTDVFFVSPTLGWVTSGAHGEGGMLLHTTDGGGNWTVELGDHESQEPAFGHLYFLDATLGWALRPAAVGKHQLLRRSGEAGWEQVGSIEAGWGLVDYVFLSKAHGVYVDGNDNVARIMRTADGGRTWRQVFACRARIVVDGLTRDVQCALKSLHFPTARVGYAIGGAHGAKRTLFVAKTEDGGNTWTLFTVGDVGGDLEVYFDQEVFFTDAQTGFAHLSDGRLYRTTDGGRSWTGLIATPGPEIKFADPEVGWSFFSYKSLSFTTDGGRRWTSREIPFPATVHAFSVPRRDRAFVVGEHGMIYRYRVIGAGESASPRAIGAPAMPSFEAALDDQVETVEEQAEALEEAVTHEVDEAGAEDTAAVLAESCCAASVDQLQATVDGLTQPLSHFIGKYRNINLVIAGLQLAGVLPDRLADVKAALRQLRTAKGAAAATAALAELDAAVAALGATTRQAFQEQPLIAAEEDGGDPAGTGTDGGPQTEESATAADSVAAQPAAIPPNAAAEARKRVERAKPKIKVRFP